jgi:hypothetical protein
MLVLAKAGDDRRKADRAVSMVLMAGDEPVGSVRILGSNMVELCVCGRAGPCWRRFDVSLLQCSTFDFLPPPQFRWEHQSMLATAHIQPEHSLSLLHLQLQHLISIRKYF